LSNVLVNPSQTILDIAVLIRVLWRNRLLLKSIVT
jgi:hypothetical protein